MGTLTVIHPQLPAVASASSAIEPSVEMADKVSKISVQVQPKSSHLKMGVHGVEQPTAFSLGKKDNFLAGGNQQQSNITAMIVVVCVGLMIAFLVLGIVRLRAAHNRQEREELQAEVEMAWDDSALNITVNPLEDDLGGIDETTGGVKTSQKSSSVVGLKSNGKMSRLTKCPTAATTTT